MCRHLGRSNLTSLQEGEVIQYRTGKGSKLVHLKVRVANKPGQQGVYVTVYEILGMGEDINRDLYCKGIGIVADKSELLTMG